MDKVIATVRSFGRFLTLPALLVAKPGRLTAYGAMALSLVIAVMASLMSSHFERQAVEAAEVRATQLARTAANQLELALFNVDRSLKRAGEEIAARWPTPPTPALRLGDFPDHIPVQLGFIDSAGMLSETALGRLPQSLHVADRDYFRTHLDTAASNTVISPPIVSRLSGR